MGFRTVVILFNDQAHEWSKDAKLGEKISSAMNHAMSGKPSEESFIGYGRVVECVHADVQTLAVVDSYNFKPLAHGHWHQGQTDEDMQLKILKEAAEKLGYRLVKQPQKKS